MRERLHHEISVICNTDIEGYFLIVVDLLKFAKESGIVYGPGRGSAASSLVVYILGISKIDPLEYDFLFERFLNPDRKFMLISI